MCYFEKSLCVVSTVLQDKPQLKPQDSPQAMKNNINPNWICTDVGHWGSYGLKQGNPLQHFETINKHSFVVILFLYQGCQKWRIFQSIPFNYNLVPILIVVINIQNQVIQDQNNCCNKTIRHLKLNLNLKIDLCCQNTQRI